DREYGQALADLLRKIGLEGQVFFSSDADTGIPVNQDIFQYLEEQIREDAYMLFLLSENFYGSVACLNEMGAAWSRKNACALLIVPGFSIGDHKVLQGAANPRQMAVEMADWRRMRQLMSDILDSCSVLADDVLVEDACKEYVEKIQKIQAQPSVQKWNQLREIERELEKDARNPELYTMRGKILMELDKKNYQKAVSDYLYAIFLDADYIDAYSELIQIAAKKKDYRQAMWFAEEACRRFPENGDSYGCRAYVKCQKGAYQEAVPDCDLAISLKENRWFYNTRGRCYLKRGFLEEALTDFWTAHRKDPKYPYAIENIIFTVRKIGAAELLKRVEENKKKALENKCRDAHYDKALMYLECLEVFDPSNEDALREYGGFHYDFGRFDRALTYWKRVLDINNSCQNNYLCGAALEGQGKYAQAREYYRTALEFPDCVFRQRAVERLEATKGL
ncbi:MAG: TIR domain-containing protein, partial [Lachnospiraceae bacterium]|nr:TIR domain-containing protein [Lachnospiraceae bacterium]